METPRYIFEVPMIVSLGISLIYVAPNILGFADSTGTTECKDSVVSNTAGH